MKKWYPLLYCMLCGTMLWSQRPATAIHASQQVDLVNDRIRFSIDLDDSPTYITLCGLQKGEAYQIWTVVPGGCEVEAGEPGKPLASSMAFVAKGSCQEIVVQPVAGNSCKEEIAVSIACQTCQQAPPPAERMANLSVVGGLSAESLIKDIFIGGDCFDVQNVTEIGSPDGKGTFSGGTSSIGIENGVILATGSIYNAPGPNNADNAGNELTGAGYDPDLAQLTGGGLFDVVGIEFDFQPTLDQLTFEYVFASEEYCEYVNTQYNDVFGFFISGPGISGPFSNNGANIAVIPNTNVFVAINTINHLSNSAWFMPNQTNCGGFTNMQDIQYDGFTVIMQAMANVIPCETYHIKLVIADVADGIYDSAVFLKANSFNAGGTATGEIVVPSTGSSFAYENCSDAFLTITRTAGDINLPFVVELNVSPSSTATPGLDYSPIPNTVVIPAGVSSITIPINVIPDQIPEGVETIILGIENSCSCSALEMVLEIHDTPPLNVLLDDYDLCQGEVLVLEPIITSGIEPYSYQWNTGSQAPFLVAVPTSNTTYTVTVSDNCNQSTVVTSHITVNQIPTAILSGSGFICSNDPAPAELTIEFTGVGPWIVNYTIDDVPQPPITTSANPYVFSVTTPGVYQLTSVMSQLGNCEGPAAGIAPVLQVEIENEFAVSQLTCTQPGGITAFPSNGVSPYTFEWSNGANSTPSITVQQPGVYSVTITDYLGCALIDSAEVTQVPPLETQTAVLNHVDCTLPTGSAEVEVLNGTPSYTYLWSNGGTTAVQTDLLPGVYTVTVTDDNGCVQVDTVSITVDTIPPTAVGTTDGMLTCENTTVNLLATGSSAGPIYTYQWSGPGLITNADSSVAQVDVPGVYTLLVSNDFNHCTATDTALVLQDIQPPEAIAEGGVINCSSPQLTLDGGGSSTGPQFQYQWTGPGIVSGGNTLTPVVNLPGTYTLTVTNALTGCTHAASALVEVDSTYPQVAIAQPALLTCSQTTVLLDGSASEAGNQIAYQWHFNGNPIPGATEPTLEVAQEGSYALHVTNMGNGCMSVAEAEVLADRTAPAVSTDVSGIITCTEPEVNLHAMVSGDPNSHAYQWSGPGIVNGADTPDPVVNQAGTYQVVVTSLENGCTSTAEVEVEIDTDIPQVVIAAPELLTCAVAEITLDASASSQEPGLEYTWTTTDGHIVSGANTLNPVVDAPGTYVLTIANPFNNCSKAAQVTVGQNIVPPQIDMPQQLTLDCAHPQDSITVEVSNVGPSFASFTWTLDGNPLPANNSPSISVNQAGQYQVMVTNTGNGCTASSATLVAMDTIHPAATIAEPSILTCEHATIGLDATGSSFGADYQIQWFTTGGHFLSGTDALTPLIDAPGTYTLSVVNTVNGCSASFSVEVEADQEIPEVDAGPDVVLNCNQPEATLQATASQGNQFVYQWTGPSILSGQTSLAPVVDQGGTYELLVTNTANGCTASDALVVGEDFAYPLADAGQSAMLNCSVTSLSLDGTASSSGPGITYQWTTTNGHIIGGADTPTPSIDASGTYLLVVTNTANGCTASDTVEIFEDGNLPNVSVASPAPITCTQQVVTLDGSASSVGPAFTYQWVTSDGHIVAGQNSPVAQVDAPGTYQLFVTNTETNCKNAATVFVADLTEPPAVEAGQALTLTCASPMGTLDAQGSAVGPEFTYQWSGPGIVSGANSLTPVVNQAGNYTLVVTNATTGCTSTDQVQVTVDQVAPLATIAPPPLLTCVATEVMLDGTASSSGASYAYQWTGPGIVGTAEAATALVNQPGTYVLLVTNTLNGCTSEVAVEVNQDVQQPIAEAGAGGTLTCEQASLQLDGTGSSSGAGFVYQWTTTDGHIVSGANSTVAVVDQPGTYLLTVTNTSNGCTNSDAVVVIQDTDKPLASVAAPGMLTCAITSVQLQANASQGSQFTYEWSTVNGHVVSGASTLQPVVDQPGTYTLLVTNTTTGCTSTASVQVNQSITPPLVDAGEPFVMNCYESVYQLQGTATVLQGGLSWSWSTADGHILTGANSPTPQIDQPGTYVLTVTSDFNGCQGSDFVVITRDEPHAVPEVYDPPCFGDRGAIVLNKVSGGTPPYLYSIDGGATFGTGPMFTELDPGLYQVVVQDANECEYSEEVLVNEPVPLDLIVSPHVEIKLGESHQIYTQVTVPVEALETIEWFPAEGLSCADCLNPVATPLHTTLYKITVRTNKGCEDSAPVLIVVNKQASVYVPNAFSPNSDGINDVFMIYGDASVAKIKSFLVFNRWGESVHEYHDFQPNDPVGGWDGTYRGMPMDPAVFAWFAEVEFVDGRVELFKGDVTLMR